MRMGIKAMAVAMLGLALVATGAFGADGTKIGLVDFQRILDVSDAGKAAQARVDVESKKMGDDLKTKGVEIEEIQKRMEQEKMVASKDTMEERGRDLRIRINDFKTLQQRYTKKARELQFMEVAKIKKDIFELAEAMGKKGGYQLIVERQEGGIVYFSDTIDLTDNLIKQYNAKYAKADKTKK
ncbi:MAG: OmpH family outer membrane protein [Desulfobacterales bacterium]|nr:OmpH family outer membrane protein [Desulfobacterales bacterium]